MLLLNEWKTERCEIGQEGTTFEISLALFLVHRYLWPQIFFFRIFDMRKMFSAICLIPSNYFVNNRPLDFIHSHMITFHPFSEWEKTTQQKLTILTTRNLLDLCIITLSINSVSSLRLQSKKKFLWQNIRICLV